MRLPSRSGRKANPVTLSPAEVCEIARNYQRTGKRHLPEKKDTTFPTRKELLGFLDMHTELINDWINWSADKRWSPAWFFVRKEEKFEVARLESGGETSESRLYESAAEACADFILKELNE